MQHQLCLFSQRSEMTLCRLILYCVYTHMVMRFLDFDNINQDRLERIEEWFDTKNEAKDDSSVAKYADRNDKRIWAESIRTHFQHKLNLKMIPRAYVLRPEGWGNPDIDQELMARG
jgi:hypothetical protein